MSHTATLLNLQARQQEQLVGSRVIVTTNRRGDWCKRHFTDDVHKVLNDIPGRAHNHGLATIHRRLLAILTLYSMLLWQRKLGVVAIENLGVDRFDLARDLDQLLGARRLRLPVDGVSAADDLIAFPSVSIFEPGHYEALFEPLFQQAERASRDCAHTWIGTEHLALAVVRTATPPLSNVLHRHCIVPENLMRSILEILR